MKSPVFLGIVAAFLLAGGVYEAVAWKTGKAPTITTLSRRYWPLRALIGVGIIGAFVWWVEHSNP